MEAAQIRKNKTYRGKDGELRTVLAIDEFGSVQFRFKGQRMSEPAQLPIEHFAELAVSEE